MEWQHQSKVFFKYAIEQAPQTNQRIGDLKETSNDTAAYFSSFGMEPDSFSQN